MFNLLFKTGLSLTLLSSLTISDSRCCASNNQPQNPAFSADSRCCPSHASPDNHPVRPVSNADCQCSVKQALATSKSRLPVPDTWISILHNSTLPSPSGRTAVEVPHFSQAKSRPLYLLHCVWIC